MEQRKGSGATAEPTPPGMGGKYLTFRLADEEYGLEIMKVQEIIGMLPVTKVPRLPDYVRGVINLRGKIIPTLELRRKFGFEPKPDTPRTCIIVVELGTAHRVVNLGLIVDEVAEVLYIQGGEIDHAPEFGSSLNVEFIKGVGIAKERVIILLDIDKVLTAEEVRSVEAIPAAG